MLLFRAKRIRCLMPLAHNGSCVFGAKRLFLASMSCVKVFRTFKAMSFQDLHWLQKLGSCKASFRAKVVQYSRQVGSTLDQHSYDTLLNLFHKPWYWDEPRKTLKHERVLNLNLVKNYLVSKRNAAKQRFFECTTLIMVIPLPLPKIVIKTSEQNKRFNEALTAVSRFLLSI